ncbi:MAG TPA: PIN domain-containing protein [Acidimicrobiales bacterium]|nr:PIN domain-containing protein [Acidimicrobiales bacterium]
MTSFWVSLYNRRDSRHGGARALIERFAGNQLATTNHVRGENWTFLRRRAGHSAAVAFLDVPERTPRVRLTQVSEQAEQRALIWLRRHDEREYSFVDATSFDVMRRLRIREAFAFDGDFAAAGYVERRP